MKAGEDLVIIRNEDGVTVPYKEGDSKEGLTFTIIEKGKEITALSAYSKSLLFKT